MENLEKDITLCNAGNINNTLKIDGSTVMASVTESVSEGASVVSTPVSTGLMTDVPIISFSSADGSAVTSMLK